MEAALAACVRDVAAMVRERYDQWVYATAMDHAMVHAAVFAVTAKKIAGAGFDLGAMLQTVLRAHGLEASEIQVVRDDGDDGDGGGAVTGEGAPPCRAS